MSSVSGRFQAGEQIRVRRSLGYYHHGIYISDDRVIQFGGGVPLLHKESTGIDAVTLGQFEQGGTAEVVRHGYTHLSVWHPPADEPWKIIDRAEFLLKLQPKLPYNLIGHNCEHMANMCAVGSWTESYQVRKFFGAKAAVSFVCLMWIASRSRANLPVPGWAQKTMIALTLISLITIGTYNHQIKLLWDEIRSDWDAHERMLAEDPRNGPQGQP
jgi:hypothetical protein